MDGKPSRVSWFAILALALALRLLAGVWWQNQLPPDRLFAFPDSEGYWSLARSIAQGRNYAFGTAEGRIFRTPGYPLVLAPLFLAFGNDPPVYAARALSAVLGTAAVAGAMGIARMLFGDRAAVVTGIANAVDPGAITLGVFVLSEAPFCPLMVAHLGAWILAARSTNSRMLLSHAVWGGAAAGMATLMRPSYLLFVPFALVAGLMVAPRKSQQLRIAGVMMLALCVTMSPWWVRNYRLTGRFIPTTLQVGASLYDGLSPQADGSSNMDYVSRFVAEQQAADQQTLQPLLGTMEERLDRRMRDASLTWAKDHPVRVTELVGIKLRRMWSPWPNAADLGSFWAKLAIALGYLPLIVLGICGAIICGVRDWSRLLLVLPAVYFTVLHSIFVSSLRYRQPPMLLIAILAAALIVYWWDRWQGKQPQFSNSLPID